jgi:hypothetical protein
MRRERRRWGGVLYAGKWGKKIALPNDGSQNLVGLLHDVLVVTLQTLEQGREGEAVLLLGVEEPHPLGVSWRKRREISKKGEYEEKKGGKVPASMSSIMVRMYWTVLSLLKLLRRSMKSLV